jgi:3-oxoacyl-(acyl-carrier-protein) synthase
VAVGALQSLFGVSAASSSLAACATVLGMAHGFLPCGLGSDDPDWEMDLVDATPRTGRIGTAMINGLALGGGMVSLILCARPS